MSSALYDPWMIRFRIASDWLYIRMCRENLIRLYCGPNDDPAELERLLRVKMASLNADFLNLVTEHLDSGNITQEEFIRIMLHPKRYIEW